MAEVHMLSGVPGSGKSTTVKKLQEVSGQAVVLNRDSLGRKVRIPDLVPMMADALNNGAERVILDNTHCTRKDRDPFTTLAQKMGVPIFCHFIDISMEAAQFNLCWRMCERYGHVLTKDEIKEKGKTDSNMFPPGVIYGFFKKLVKPTKAEGFNVINVTTVKKRTWKLPEDFHNKGAIFDYDGTLRECVGGNGMYPTDPSHIEIIKGVPKKLKALRDDGYILVGASNQSGVAKGVFTEAECRALFDATNEMMGVKIDVMFDTSRAGPPQTWHRKPMPGMLVDAIWKYKLNPDTTFFVGDKKTDKTCAQRAGIGFYWADKFF